MDTWCRAYFIDGPTCDVVHNNMSESFNSAIRLARAKPIILMLEDIRIQIMQRMAARIKKMGKWNGKITPYAEAELAENKERSLFAKVISNGKHLWEVSHNDDACVVNMESRTCTCREWSLTGIPCYHALAVINAKNEDALNYVSPFFYRETWEKAYEHVLCPLNGEKMWPRSAEPAILPPKSRKMPGRPKRNRVKAPHESPSKTGKLSKHGRKITCSYCLQIGHNKAYCATRNAGGEAAIQTEKRARGRPPVVSQASSSTGVPPQRRKKRPPLTPAAWNEIRPQTQ